MKKNTRILILMFLVAFLPLLVGCIPSPTPPITENQAPLIVSTPVTTAKVGVEYVYNVTAIDPDEDTLTYSLTVKPSGMTINSVTGVISWKPICGQAGDNPVIVEASDGALSDTQSFTIKVSTPSAPPAPPVNHAPIITSIPGDTAIVGVKYIYTIKATDQDGDVLTYSFVSGPVGMTFDGTATISWTPVLGQIGPNGVTVKASDGKKATTQSFTITVKAVELIGIEVEPNRVTLNTLSLTGITQQLEVTAYYDDGNHGNITFDCIYVSNNSQVASVNVDGLVTAICPGTVDITIFYTPDGLVFTDTAEVTVEAAIVIDGILSPGEWDCSYLGTSITKWGGGMSVDVYGFADSDYLYVAYEADVSQPGWGVASGLCVNMNLYYSIVYDTGFKDTLFQTSFWGDNCQVMQTEDWVSWICVGTLDAVGIEYYYIDMYTTPTEIAEFKIPLSLLETEGASQIELYGQYWQYDWSELFYVELP